MVEFLRAWLTVYAHDFTSKSFNAIIALLTAQRDLIDAGYDVVVIVLLLLLSYPTKKRSSNVVNEMKLVFLKNYHKKSHAVAPIYQLSALKAGRARRIMDFTPEELAR